MNEALPLSETLRVNLAAILARARVRVVASWRETSWVVGETVFPFLTMSAFVLVYRGHYGDVEESIRFDPIKRRLQRTVELLPHLPFRDIPDPPAQDSLSHLATFLSPEL